MIHVSCARVTALGIFGGLGGNKEVVTVQEVNELLVSLRRGASNDPHRSLFRLCLVLNGLIFPCSGYFVHCFTPSFSLHPRETNRSPGTILLFLDCS